MKHYSLSIYLSFFYLADAIEFDIEILYDYVT